MAHGAVIGVLPGRELDARRRLFDALEVATGARFAPWSEAEGPRVDAVIVLSSPRPPEGIRSLVFAPGDGPPAGALVGLGRESGLDRRLWSRRLRDDEAVGIRSLPTGRGDIVLARTEDGLPLWIRTGIVDRAAVVPRELGRQEVLRDAFRSGRFLSLLPLLHLIREVEREPRWRPPPLRASFVFDDPNLRRPSYGFVRYAELERHAERHGYHVAMATIPLDAWTASPKAAAFFQGDQGPLSLVVHGNDHVSRELGRSRSDAEALALVAQALRRIDRLECRAQVQVARVMIPPHGALSEGVARALLRTGYEAACANRPYPWLKRPPADRPLAGWDVSEVVVGGLPLIPRFRLKDRDDLPLRAFLDQPLVLYGHSEDLADGYDVLAEAAQDVNSLGGVEWVSPLAIARTNYTLCEQGDTTKVRLFSRNARIRLPESAQWLVVKLPASADGLEHISVTSGRHRRNVAPIGEAVAVAGQWAVDVVLTRRDSVSPLAVHRPRRRPWPILRRTLTEARDRALPRIPRVVRAVQGRTSGM